MMDDDDSNKRDAMGDGTVIYRIVTDMIFLQVNPPSERYARNINTH